MQAYTVLITGATAGLGRHTELLLAGRGHRVIASGRNEAALASLRSETPMAIIETIPLDVTSVSSIADACIEVDRLTEYKLPQVRARLCALLTASRLASQWNAYAVACT